MAGANKAWKQDTAQVQHKPQKRAESQPSSARLVGQVLQDAFDLDPLPIV